MEGRASTALSDRRSLGAAAGMMGKTVKRQPQPLTEPSLVNFHLSSSPAMRSSADQSDHSLPVREKSFGSCFIIQNTQGTDKSVLLYQQCPGLHWMQHCTYYRRLSDTRLMYPYICQPTLVTIPKPAWVVSQPSTSTTLTAYHSSSNWANWAVMSEIKDNFYLCPSSPWRVASVFNGNVGSLELTLEIVQYVAIYTLKIRACF